MKELLDSMFEVDYDATENARAINMYLFDDIYETRYKFCDGFNIIYTSDGGFENVTVESAPWLQLKSKEDLEFIKKWKNI